MFNSIFWLGFILGKLYNNHIILENQPVSFAKKNKIDSNNTKPISIDDTKYVSKINTDSLEKKYDSLGDVKASTEQINNSISKLKNLKG